MLGSIPEDVARFLHDHVDSIDRLEILRVLGEDREREWDSVALAGAIQSEPQAVRDHLAAMHSLGLLVVALRGPSLGRHYGARSPELEEMVNRLLRWYNERPVTAIKMVYERAMDPGRAFSDAPRAEEA